MFITFRVEVIFIRFQHNCKKKEISGSALCFSDIVYDVFELGPHDGIWGTVKRLVYQEVSSGCIVTEDARQFANEAVKLCKIRGKYKYKALFYF